MILSFLYVVEIRAMLRCCTLMFSLLLLFAAIRLRDAPFTPCYARRRCFRWFTMPPLLRAADAARRRLRAFFFAAMPISPPRTPRAACRALRYRQLRHQHAHAPLFRCRRCCCRLRALIMLPRCSVCQFYDHAILPRDALRQIFTRSRRLPFTPRTPADGAAAAASCRPSFHYHAPRYVGVMSMSCGFRRAICARFSLCDAAQHARWRAVMRSRGVMRDGAFAR